MNQIQQSKINNVSESYPALVMYEKSLQNRQLPRDYDHARFIINAMALMQKNPQIDKCLPQSVAGALLLTAAYNIDPNPDLGQVYYIPRKTQNGGLALEFKIGYRGLLELAYRNANIKKVDADIVYKNDEFQVIKSADTSFIHKPNFVNRGEPILAYAYAIYKGELILRVMNATEINEVRAMSDAQKSSFSPWNTRPLEMWKKTVLRNLFKVLPLEITKGVTAYDDAIIPVEAIKEISSENITADFSIVETTTPAEIETVEAVEVTEPTPVRTQTPKPAPETQQTPPPIQNKPNTGEKFLSPEELSGICDGSIDWVKPKIYGNSIYLNGAKIRITREQQAQLESFISGARPAAKTPAPQPKRVEVAPSADPDDLPF